MKHHEASMATEPPQDQPPPYEAVPQHLEGIRVNDDGRISIDASSRLCRTLSRIISTSPIETPPPSGLPPCYEDLPGEIFSLFSHWARNYNEPDIVSGSPHNVFENFVAEAGLEFYPIGGDPADLMSYMVKNPGLIPSVNSLKKGDIQKNRLMMAEILHGCWHSCVMPDPVTNAPFVAEAIIANPPSFAHVIVPRLSVSHHLMFTMPWTATRAFPHPLANLYNIPPDQDWINRVSYSVVDWLSWQGLGGVINDWRKHEVGLEFISSSDDPFLLKNLEIPYTYCWSPGLVSKPHDWLANIDVCGFFFRKTPDYEPDSELIRFLHSGPPPIYVGFGSIVIENPGGMTEILLQAIQETGVRVIISRGWSRLGGPILPHVLYLDDCPREWLFQHVRAVVHHGGACTTACGLRNGKPTVVSMLLGDMISAAEAGPDPIPYKQLNVSNLVQAIRYCLTPEATHTAQGVANKMQQDQGVEAAVASFHRNLPRVTECDVLPQFPACWRYKKGNRRYHLSKVAAEILAENHVLDPTKLKLYQLCPMHIENKRWDLVTGVSSAGLGMAFEMLKAGGNIIYKPYGVYKLLLAPSPDAVGSSPALRKARSMPYLTEANISDLEEKGKARAMAVASAQASGRFLGKFVSGTMIDVPLAAAEGFRVLPGLCGGNVRHTDKVTDWKSGMLAGAKTFAVSMAESCVDPFYQPYRHARDGSALGFAARLFKGTFGVIAKMGHAPINLLAYPGQGVKRSFKAAFFDSTQKAIMTTLREDGQGMSRQWRVRGLQDKLVVEKFRLIDREDDSY
ncbi:uncharacterized protein N7483_006331 [Penicillium malachiteum]|uniref:uncharacterized protein n=1 Tax=Penicillium malachiteum TaxID=1324776 RepID=UPI0025490864|nr:uncharacterized protein N7483_006331 [Penicillium malachiteum]KAJ5724974.1 hypothetical protein N7483_006331 [Penicillium malachiteum]